MSIFFKINFLYFLKIEVEGRTQWLYWLMVCA